MKPEAFYATYKFYDERGRRLAIFGRLVADEAIEGDDGEVKFENPQIQVYVVTCGDKDRFNKKKANLIFKGRSEGGSPKGEYLIPLDKEQFEKPKWTFIRWCEENYYKHKVVTFEFEANVLVRDTKDGEEPLPGIDPISDLRVKDTISWSEIKA